MPLYEKYLLPHLINCACGTKEIERQRSLVVPKAKGRVLEIGMGSGLNLKHYEKNQVEHLWGLEPSEGMRKKAQSNINRSNIPVDWLGLPSEKIPLDDNVVDTIVLTYTLCTIADTKSALAEMKRVLKPNGLMLFCEHGLSPEKTISQWQTRINPIWKKIAGGCNLNRNIPNLISMAGFEFRQLNQEYIKGPKIATYQYWGVASI